jgi:hypothetical protein
VEIDHEAKDHGYRDPEDMAVGEGELSRGKTAHAEVNHVRVVEVYI